MPLFPSYCHVGHAVLAGLLALACGPDCEEPKFELGERLQITVTEREEVVAGSECVPLQPGDQISLTVWGSGEDNFGCPTQSLAPQVPSFFPNEGITWSCSGSGCVGVMYDVMDPSYVEMELGVSIQQGDIILDDVPFEVDWSPARASGLERCTERFLVRVELIDRVQSP